MEIRNPRGAGRKPKGRIPSGLSLRPEVIAIINALAEKSNSSRNDAAEILIKSGAESLQSAHRATVDA